MDYAGHRAFYKAVRSISTRGGDVPHPLGDGGCLNPTTESEADERGEGARGSITRCRAAKAGTASRMRTAGTLANGFFIRGGVTHR
jgi:hypothetical protein